jgi:hypothetical protein
MRPATRKSTRESHRGSPRGRMIRIMATIILALVSSIGFLVPKAAAQSDKYSKMAPVDQYLMERNAEILLARSAASNSISNDATILVLGRQGYETVAKGKNGFVCMVERSWMEAFDSPEFWNPKVRGAECLNRQAARSILPITDLRTIPVLTGSYRRSYRRRTRPRPRGCRRFLCSQSKLQSGPTERPHPCIKRRLTTTQPPSSSLASRVVCPANCWQCGSSSTNRRPTGSTIRLLSPLRLPSLASRPAIILA